MTNYSQSHILTVLADDHSIMKVPEQYRRSVLIAVTLHVALIVFMIVRLSPTLYRAPNAYQPKPFDSIKAVVIIPSQQTPAPIKQPDELQQQKAAEERLAQEQQQEKLVKIEKQQAAAKLQAEKLQKIAQLQAAQLAQKQALRKAKAKQLRETALKTQAREQTLAKQKVLTTEQKKLQQMMMQQQLNSEQKDLSQIQTKAMVGKIDQYKAQILALIQSNWRIDQVNSQLKCVYFVEVAPDGEVLSITLAKRSGDDALDQSARQAIMASSPLPVPKAPELFSHFRQLVLTLSPQGYLQSVGSA